MSGQIATEDEIQQVEEETEGKLTKYIVLHAEGTGWSVVGTYAGHSPEKAIRRGCIGRLSVEGDGEDRFVAVPARSWKPVTVRAEQTTILKLEDAG